MGILRFIFSVILSRELGAEGMGLFSLIMPVYDLFACLVCGGIISAVSKEAAAYFAKKQYKNLYKTVNVTFNFILFWSVIISIILFFMSGFLTDFVIKDTRALYSLQVICPALVFIALSSVLKGYFFGTSKVVLPAAVDIAEKAVRIAVVISLIKIFLLKDIEKTVTIVYLSLSLGEVVSFIFLLIFYNHIKNKNSCNDRKQENKSQLLFNVLVVAFPLCLNGFLSTAISMVSTLILPGRLMACGYLYKDTLEMIGKFTGMALNITAFSIVVIASMSIVLIPDISQSFSIRDYYSLEKRIKTVLKFAFILGLSTMAICFAIPDSLGKLFYNRTDLDLFIKVASVSMPFIYISATTFTILSGLGKQNAVLIVSLLTAVEELIFLYILTGIQSINIYGYGISLTISCITSFILNFWVINKVCSVSFSFSEIFIQILSSIFLYYILVIISRIIPSSLLALKNIVVISLGYCSVIFISRLGNSVKKT